MKPKFMIGLILMAFIVRANTQEDPDRKTVDKQENYQIFAEEFCQKRGHVFEQCMGFSNAECKEMIVGLLGKCEQEGESEDSSLSDDEQAKCFNEEYVLYLEERGYDPEKECEFEL